MNSQPNEIITHILSYLDNYTLMFARGVCHKWKHLIETRIFYKTTIPALHVCILTSDYYHFGKYYLDYNYDTKTIYIEVNMINDAIYYDNLVITLANKKIFHNVMRFLRREKRIIGSLNDPVIPQKNLHISINQLLVYASYRGHFEVVKYLINIGADCQADYDGALRRSIEEGHLEIVKYLVSIGANLHAANYSNLQNSALNGHLEVFKYLVSVGADPHENYDHALQLSAENGHIEIVKYLSSIGADIHVDNDVALRWSAVNDHLEVVKYLISIGADVHAGNDWILRGGGAPGIIKYLKSISNKN